MDVLTAETCLCGSPHWHKLVHEKVVWCKRCGAVRVIYHETLWYIPLDRASVPRMKGGTIPDMPRVADSQGVDETPTGPGVEKP